MKEKGVSSIVVIAIVIVVVAVVSVGIYFILKGGEEDIGEATSLDLKMDITAEGETITARVRVKNIGTPNIKFRIDEIAGVEENFTNKWILDAGESKAWEYSGGEWRIGHYSGEDLLVWQNQLSRWVRGETNYTYEGATVRVYDIVVNPDLPDSLFQPSAPVQPPAISMSVEASGDNEIIIRVLSGSIAAGEWAYSVSPEMGSYMWVTGTEALEPPYVSLGAYVAGTWYVNVKHIPSGHIYFSYDMAVTLPAP